MSTRAFAAVLLAIALVGRAANAAPADDGGCSNRGTALYFGNGVMTTYDEAMEEADDALPGLADEAKVTDVAELGVAYNHTDGMLADVIQTLTEKEAEDSRFGWFLLNNVTSDLLHGLGALKILQLPTGGAALVTTLKTVINAGILDSNHQLGTFYDSDVADQVSGYEESLNAGYRVIVVAHSQGNLYANACHAALAGQDSTALASFGIVAVAEPAEFSFNGYVTSDSDNVINALRTLGTTVLPANVHVPTNLDDFTGHLFEATYVNAQLPLRPKVVALLSHVATAVPYPVASTTACGGSEGSGGLPIESTCTFDNGGANAMIEGSVAHGAQQTYSLEATAGAGLIVRVVDTAGTAFVPAFKVSDPAGTIVVNGASGADVASWGITTKTSGTYTVSVYDASNNTNSTGAYALYWTLAPGADACGPLVPGAEISNKLTKGSLHSYTFDAQPGEGVILRVTDVAGGTLVPAFNVYDPTGATVVNGAKGADVASWGITTQKTGTYTVVVYDASAGNAATGAYNLYFTIAPGANKGGALTPGGEVTSQLAKGALDSYTFDAQPGEGVILRVTDVAGGTLVPAFSVYDPTGATVVNGANGADVASWGITTQKTGTYTVVVYDASAGDAATGPYNLYFTIAPGANKGGALTPGGEVTSQLAKGALDSYTFDAQPGEGVILRVTDVAGGTLVPAFTVYDPTGATVVNGANGADVASWGITTQKGGTYTVVVYDGSTGNAATGAYNLYFTIAPGANKGGALTPGGEVTSQLAKGALDSYTFDAQPGDGVILRVTDVAGGNMVPSFSVYDPTGATVVNGAKGADVASWGITTQKGGTYTVVVYDGSTGNAATGAYDLTFSLTPPAQ